MTALGARTIWSAFRVPRAARRRVRPRLLKTLDAAAGTAIGGFGGLLAWRTLRESS